MEISLKIYRKYVLSFFLSNVWDGGGGGGGTVGQGAPRTSFENRLAKDPNMHTKFNEQQKAAFMIFTATGKIKPSHIVTVCRLSANEDAIAEQDYLNTN